MIHRQEATAAGSGQDRIRIDLGAAQAGLASGIYLARVSDGMGRASPAVKFVIVE